MKKTRSLFLYAFLFPLCFSFPNLLKAQKGTSFGLMVGPEFSTRIYQQNFQIQKKPRLGFVIQGHAHFNFSRHLSLDVGVGYGYKRFKEIQARRDYNGLLLTRTTSVYSFHSVDFPVLMKVYFGRNNTGIYTGIGINPILFIRSIIQYELEDPDFDPGPYYLSYSDIHLKIAPQIAFGFRQPLDEELDFNVELYANFVPWNIISRFALMINSGIRVGLWF